MKNPPNSPQTDAAPPGLWKRIPKWVYLLAMVLAGYAGWQAVSEGDAAGERVTFEVRRGPLKITVIEGGSIEALESQMIRSEIRGHQGTKILKIVDEGYLVTDEDVRTNKILVELDSAELQQRLLTEETELESRLALLTEAQQAYEIQIVQNQSDIKAAQQKVKFARMDLDKFMGEKAAQELIDEIGLKVPEPPDPEKILRQSAPPPVQTTSPPVGPTGGLPPELAMQLAQAGGQARIVTAESFEGIPPINLQPIQPATTPPPAREPSPEQLSMKPKGFNVDFSKYADTNKLGDGTALQDLRKKQDDQIVATNELKLAITKLDGTRRLYERKFVTRNELDNEELNVEKMRLRVDTADTALRLHIKYEFPKVAEETVSKYEESLTALDKAYRETISKLAQARARKSSAENRYEMGRKQVADSREQLNKCVITAEKSGLVVYGGGGDAYMYYGGQEQIREGATVRERQAIITIPDMNKMSVALKIHESHIKKVRKDLKAEITLDAFPDETLLGTVTKVGVLPDSQNRWMSPDMKVYLTTVAIDSTHEWVKPGMSAKVEILVNELKDAVYIPLQAVDTRRGKSYCHVVNGGKVEEREVVTGEFNDEFIAVAEGLKEGELVMLRPPKVNPEEGGEDGDETPVEVMPEQQASL